MKTILYIESAQSAKISQQDKQHIRMILQRYFTQRIVNEVEGLIFNYETEQESRKALKRLVNYITARSSHRLKAYLVDFNNLWTEGPEKWGKATFIPKKEVIFDGRKRDNEPQQKKLL